MGYGVMTIYISARERKILKSLLARNEAITVKDLADQLDVSARTIHRDLKGVEEILQEYELNLIKKSGVGIKVAGSAEKINELYMFLFQFTHHEYTPEERQTMILCSLLEAKEPVKLLTLAHDLHVTIATISNDLTSLQEKLESFGLTLIRRRGYGVEITGSETAKRRAMSSIILEHVDEFQFLSLVRENIHKKSVQETNSLSEKLLGLVEKQKLLIVEKTIEDALDELPYSFADSAYIGLVIHLALAIERILQGENIKIEQAYLNNLQETMEFQIAKKIIEKLEKVFQLAIPTAEIGYITMHLRGAKLRHDKEYVLEETSFNIAVKAKSLIDYVAEACNKDLASNYSLFQGLVAHLRPAMYRIKENMGIHNPLLEKIKLDYSQLFSIVKAGVEKIFADLDVPDEEIGYLVLHFGSALIGNKEREYIKALIICSSGIGTSKMLATRLYQEIPEIKESQNVSLFELDHLDLKEYDLVISTIQAPELPEDYILVNPILPQDDIDKIKANLRKRRGDIFISTKVSLKDKQLKDSAKLLEGIENIKAYSEAIVTVLEHFQLTEIGDVPFSQQVINIACQHLFKRGIIDNVQAVTASLREREKIGGLGIPNTRMALFHARDEHILNPSFTIYRLHVPLTVKSMDQAWMEVEQMLLLLSPQQASKQILEVLSYISALIIEDDNSIALFESDDSNQILAHLTTKLAAFFYEKVEDKRSR